MGVSYILFTSVVPWDFDLLNEETPENAVVAATIARAIWRQRLSAQPQHWPV